MKLFMVTQAPKRGRMADSFYTSVILIQAGTAADAIRKATERYPDHIATNSRDLAKPKAVQIALDVTGLAADTAWHF